MRNKQCIYESSMVESLASAPKLFHSYVRRRKKGCPSVGPLKSSYGRVVSNAADMSELLANAFSAVFVEGAPPVAAQHQSFAGVLDEVFVSPENVVKVLSALSSFSAAGPDGLHPHLLKACSAALSLPLYFLFERSLDKEVLSNLWKTSIIAPL